MTSKNKSILITGASGLIGSALCPALIEQGHTVQTLSRTNGDLHWNIDKQTLESGALDKVDCVIHLAGESIAQRWTAKTKKLISRSRTESTRLLTDSILKQKRPIDFISASGINFYGGGETREPATEETPAGTGFLARVCQEWEGAAQPLQEAGLRTVFIRTGVVLSSKGGALAKMLPPFKLGIGGKIGTGNQKMSWISLTDIVRIYIRAVEDEGLTGPVNATTPQAVSNAEFTKALGRAVNRPAICPLPAAVVKLIFGEMGRNTILSDLNVVPAKLLRLGFQWKHPDLDNALENEL